ncbi:DUF262 domain-containing protein [Lactiplantibacillus plantarum]|uniref:DUF262 domain-containing protein n=1 Tax=Lactiplantibacillus plantarum TaxID=1590 RepID=UPI0009763EFE|nr:DUF262 domain-containing protein [Lactiplantibacillus plantarum]PKX60345.1 DUF262 domain-containing protein [Lactiplantibacillus plantarum]
MTVSSQKLKIAQTQLKSLQKQIDYDTRDFPIAYMVDRFKSNDYFIPTYQRNKVWNQHDKERFIESLLLNYPIPLIFLSEQENGKLEIVDGVQRITTLVSFFQQEFSLKKLDKLTALNNFGFLDLPIAQQRKLKDKSLRVIVLSDKTELETRIDLFNRLNTSAKRATDSEIRSGTLSKNEFQILIEELAQSDLFQKTVHLSDIKTNRKEDIELVSRFFAYSNNYKNFKHSVTDFITDYIVYEGASWTVTKKRKLKQQFTDAFKFAQANFKPGFLQNDKNQTPRVRFEALMVGISLALRKKPNLTTNIDDTTYLLNMSEFHAATTTDGSNSPKRVTMRVELVRDYLLKERI